MYWSRAVESDAAFVTQHQCIVIHHRYIHRKLIVHDQIYRLTPLLITRVILNDYLDISSVLTVLYLKNCNCNTYGIDAIKRQNIDFLPSPSSIGTPYPEKVCSILGITVTKVNTFVIFDTNHPDTHDGSWKLRNIAKHSSAASDL